MPSSSNCAPVYQKPCCYDVDSDHRRKAAKKRDIEAWKGQNDALGTIVASIWSSTDAEVAEIGQHIRADESIDIVAKSLKKRIIMLEHSGVTSAEGDPSNFIGRASNVSGMVKHMDISQVLAWFQTANALLCIS